MIIKIHVRQSELDNMAKFISASYLHSGFLTRRKKILPRQTNDVSSRKSFLPYAECVAVGFYKDKNKQN